MIGPPDMADVVRSFSYPITRWRYGGPPTVTPDGGQVPAAPSSATITGHIYPPSGAQLKALPEGHTVDNTRMMSSADDVRIADLESQTRGDLIAHEGRVFEVKARQPYTAGASGAASYQVYALIEVFDRLPP